MDINRPPQSRRGWPAAVYISLIALVVLAHITLVGGVIWAAIHFISKYW